MGYITQKKSCFLVKNDKSVPLEEKGIDKLQRLNYYMITTL